MLNSLHVGNHFIFTTGPEAGIFLHFPKEKDKLGAYANFSCRSIFPIISLTWGRMLEVNTLAVQQLSLYLASILQPSRTWSKVLSRYMPQFPQL